MMGEIWRQGKNKPLSENIFMREPLMVMEDLLMTKKLNNKELEQKVIKLEKDSLESHKIKKELLLIKRALETTGDAIGVTDSKGSPIYHNKALTDLFGYSQKEFKEAGGPAILYENQHVAEEVLETVGNGKSWKGEIEMVSRTGRKFPVSLHADAIFDDAGKFIGIIGIHRDITKIKQTEEALRKSEKLYRLLADNVSDIIWTMDMNMNFTFFSPSVTHLRGFSVEEAMAQKIEESMTPDSYKIAMECFNEELEILQKGERDPERSMMLELELLCKDGSTIWAELIMKFYYNSDGDPVGVIGVSRDNTEKKLLQADAIRAGHLASLGELAAGVAHEINNPITGVINYAEILKDEFNERSEDTNIPERIINEGERIAKIVRNLLSFSQDRKDHRGPVHIKDIISDTLSLVEQHILNEGIILVVDGFSELPNIGARYQEIQQVFLNILRNARYALNQKISLSHKDKIIEIKGETIKVGSRDYVRTTFYDCGLGISEEIQDKICDPFFSSKPKDMGTGLGLSISLGIIKNHKGRLLFESVEGQYTKAFVDLPVWEEDQS